MAELVLYTNPQSRGQIARWMLEEVGAPYRAEILSYGEAMRAPDYLALNPMGKVPTLVHGDVKVTECAAICAYLADAFPQAGLAPPVSDPLRGPYYRWLFFGAGPVEAAVINASMGIVTDAPELRRRVGYGTLAAVLDTLEALLADREWILGERFSAADVYLGAQIVWGLRFGTMAARPVFQDYAARLNERPAAQRAREADEALIAKDRPQAG